MNKKKVTAAVVAVMVVQILVCSFMIGYNAMSQSAILKKGTEYKFAISEISMKTDEEDGFLHISFPHDNKVDYYYNSGPEVYSVIEVGEDALARIVRTQSKQGERISHAYDSYGCYTDDFELKVDSETADQLKIFSSFIDEFCGTGYYSYDDAAWLRLNRTEYKKWFDKLENEKLIELAQKQIDSKTVSNIVDSYVTASVYKGKILYKEFYIGDILVATINN